MHSPSPPPPVCVLVCLGSLVGLDQNRKSEVNAADTKSKSEDESTRGRRQNTQKQRACHSWWGRQQNLLLNIKQCGLHVLRAISCIISQVVGVGVEINSTLPRASAALMVQKRFPAACRHEWNGDRWCQDGRGLQTLMKDAVRAASIHLHPTKSMKKNNQVERRLPASSCLFSR